MEKRGREEKKTIFIRRETNRDARLEIGVANLDAIIARDLALGPMNDLQCHKGTSKGGGREKKEDMGVDSNVKDEVGSGGVGWSGGTTSLGRREIRRETYRSAHTHFLGEGDHGQGGCAATLKLHVDNLG